MRTPQNEYQKDVLSFLEQAAQEHGGDIETAAGNILDQAVDDIVQSEGGGKDWETMKETILLLTAPGYMTAVQHSGDGGLTRSDWYPVGPEFGTVEEAKEWAQANVNPTPDGRNMFCHIVTWDYDQPKDESMVFVSGVW